MKIVEIRITNPAGKEDISPVGVYVEENRGGSAGWHRLSSRDVVTNSDATKVNVLANQRIMIDPFPTPEMVYDRDQGASINPRTQLNRENRADRAEAREEDRAQSEALKQEQQRLAAAAKLQGGDVPPVGQATPPTSAQAAQPSSGPRGTPLEAQASRPGQPSGQEGPGQPQTGQQPRSTTASPAQAEQQTRGDVDARTTAAEEQRRKQEADAKAASDKRIADAKAAATRKG